MQLWGEEEEEEDRQGGSVQADICILYAVLSLSLRHTASHCVQFTDLGIWVQPSLFPESHPAFSSPVQERPVSQRWWWWWGDRLS